jgi:quinol monooxygenase YgiN
MPILLKVHLEFKEGRRDDFVKNQEALMAVTLNHPGVLCYHAAYPEGKNCSDWTEIYADDGAFKAHLEDLMGKAPLGAVMDASAEIVCECSGNPDEESKKLLAGFGTIYNTSGSGSFLVRPEADKDSTV